MVLLVGVWSSVDSYAGDDGMVLCRGCSGVVGGRRAGTFSSSRNIATMSSPSPRAAARVTDRVGGGVTTAVSAVPPCSPMAIAARAAAARVTHRRSGKGSVRSGSVRFGSVWFGSVRFSLVWVGSVWYGMVWYGSVWFGMVWVGLVWCGLGWFGSVRFGSA